MLLAPFLAWFLLHLCSSPAPPPSPPSSPADIGRAALAAASAVPQVTADVPSELLLPLYEAFPPYFSSLPTDLQSLCVNLHERCTAWAAQGECAANPNFMQLQCRPACRSCDLLLYSNRCPVPDDLSAAYEPGDLDRVFEAIALSFPDLQPRVVSSPPDPWLVVFDAFISAQESRALIDAGTSLGFARSTGIGPTLPDGQHERVEIKSRTSRNAWCKKDSVCETDPLVVRVNERVEQVTRIPYDNYEHLQLLHYREGEFYHLHHDFLPNFTTHDGNRLVTLFIYLNDVEEGGETWFPDVLQGGIKIKPKLGRAVLWPNVMNQDPAARDGRTYHEALAVTKGEKYAANAWGHIHGFKALQEKHCTS
ncbi:hypothetical protein TeGR_g8016 [Tetraparma gracilis]|uniref:Fe2OG dioxygenase domain-containing protein n=1 Tax=Tetraparma gracilis TaxID=2962635 RepID=A0ABQ6MHM0_9STRA|nr:hypothetical protein TeGR_g8016 [Tetraparma gracilis]